MGVASLFVSPLLPPKKAKDARISEQFSAKVTQPFHLNLEAIAH
jgi:hypothetical protein